MKELGLLDSAVVILVTKEVFTIIKMVVDKASNKPANGQVTSKECNARHEGVNARLKKIESQTSEISGGFKTLIGYLKGKGEIPNDLNFDK